MSVQRGEGTKSAGHLLPEGATHLDDAAGVDFKDVIGILSRRKRWIFGVTAAFCVLAGGYILIARPAYTATAQVYVDPRDRPTSKDDPGSQSSVPGDGLLLVESQLKIITSNEVLTRVVDEMGLRKDPEFNGEGGLTASIKSVLGLGQPVDPALAALRNLRLKTSAKRNDRSFVIDIMASADTPERATKLADTVANAYLEEQASANASFNRRMSDAISSQLDRMRNAVSQAEQAVAAYKAANNLVGSRNRLVTEQELDEANTQLTNAQTKLAEAQARVKLIETIEAGGMSLDALPEAIQSGSIVQLRARAADISRDEAQLAQINGPSHPALQAARAQVRDVQAAIKNEVKLITQAVRNTATSERANVQNLQARFDTLKTLSQTNEKAIVPLRELERKADSNRAIYETFLSKAKTASEQQVIDTSNIRLISRATPPDRKSWPPTAILMAAALFGGLTLGVALALARESLGRSEQEQRPLPPQPDGIPPNPTQKPAATFAEVRPPVVPQPSMSRQEQLARLSTELLAAPVGHSILLVRASSDDGLALIALELARAVDEAGKKTMVIDADLLRHPVTSRLGFDQHPGFRDIMAGRSSIHDAARPLGRTNIRVVPVGRTGVMPPVHQMRGVLNAALRQARDFDRIILDGGELGTTSSEYGLYSMTDQVIFLASGRSNEVDDVKVLVDVLRQRLINAKAVVFEPVVHAVAA